MTKVLKSESKDIRMSEEEKNCLNCKKFLMIGICHYSDFCEDFSEYEPRDI